MAYQRKKYLIKNTALFALGNFSTKVISFFFVPIYTNILTASEYGTVDLIFTVGTVLAPLLTFNICESVMRFALDKDAEQKKIMSTGICALFFATIAGVVLFPLAGVFKNINEYTKYLYLYIISFSYSQMFLCYLRGREMLLKYSIGNIIHALNIVAFNILFLVVWQKGIKGYLTAYIIANFITTVYAFIAGHVVDVLRDFKIDIKLSKQMMKYAVVLIPNSFMWWIMNSSDRLMVTAITGTAVNGVYAVAYKVPTLLSTLTQVFNQAWSYSAIHEEGGEDEEKYSNEMYNRLVAIVSICASGLMMIMKIFLKYYVGAEYYEAWRYTPVLIIGFVFSTLGSFVATSYTVHKDSMGYLVSGTAGAIINLILNIILIPCMGAMGAAIATAFSYFVVYIFRINNTKKYIKINVLQKQHLIGYFILFIEVLTMFIKNPIGQVILAIEFLLVFIMYRVFFMDCIKQVKYLRFPKR
ncbi:MAG: oligosaccharide flippase family protein [Clostridiaceae bacterium]|nr:oligosaccharide flippase family protein [Clostridiaceae bacterium]